MSKRTRCRQCDHTPGEWDIHERKSAQCGCLCHAQAPLATGYGPSPASRPAWPRSRPQFTAPLVIRRYPVHPTGNDFYNFQDKGTGREHNPFAPVRR